MFVIIELAPNGLDLYSSYVIEFSTFNFSGKIIVGTKLIMEATTSVGKAKRGLPPKLSIYSAPLVAVNNGSAKKINIKVSNDKSILLLQTPIQTINNASPVRKNKKNGENIFLFLEDKYSRLNEITPNIKNILAPKPRIIIDETKKIKVNK
tara:strand:+ start:149 stop:601 length:453 start_codon:yes stop_codon:yes gene_type:complete